MRISPLAPHREIYILCGALLMGCVITIVTIITGVISISIDFLLDAVSIVVVVNFLSFFLVLRLFYLLHTQRTVVEIHETQRGEPARLYTLAYCRHCQRRVCAFCGKCHSADCADPAPVCDDAAPLLVAAVPDADRATLRGLWTFPLFSAEDD